MYVKTEEDISFYYDLFNKKISTEINAKIPEIWMKFIFDEFSKNNFWPKLKLKYSNFNF